MTIRTLLVLSELSFELGLIGISEYEERYSVARWMAEDDASYGGHGDPREPPTSESEPRPIEDEHTKINSCEKVSAPDWMELVVLGKWLFTKSDPDSYPSTPHGHLYSADRKWPKLDPYTGRVFKAKHQEDPNLRLSKSDMQRLWSDHAFRDFCRSYILLYLEIHPSYKFQVKNPLRFPRW